MKNETPPHKFIAIYDTRNSNYRWYPVGVVDFEKRDAVSMRSDNSPLVCTDYFATGRFISRDDGERAEIFEQRDPPKLIAGRSPER